MTDAEREFDRTLPLLDILVLAAESWKLLLIFPILAGLLTFGLASLQTRIFESKATLQMLWSPAGAVFSRNLVAQALANVPDAPDIDAVIAGLKLGAPVQKLGRVVQVPVAFASPDKKRVLPILRAILKEYQLNFLDQIRNEYRSSYQTIVDSMDRDIAGRRKLLDRLMQPSTALNSNSAALISFQEGLEQQEQRKADAVRGMEHLPDFLVTEPPSDPILIKGPRTVMAAIFAMLGAILFAISFIVVSDLVRLQAMQPGGAAKLSRLRRALGLRALTPTDPSGN
jgi:hypothetical protein